MDLDSAVASLAERDRWKGRLEALRTELQEVREHRRAVAVKLRRMAREVRRLQALAEELVQTHAPLSRGGWRSGGPAGSNISVR